MLCKPETLSPPTTQNRLEPKSTSSVARRLEAVADATEILQPAA